MPTPLTGVLVLIASPGDATEERAAVRDALVDWNVDRGRREQIALLPWLYERHAVPKLGDRPQAIINAQAVDQADVVVAFFDSRLGTATGLDVSGTAEEINRAHDLGKPVHVYFSEEPLPRDVDEKQLGALRKFQDDLESKGLLGKYRDPRDLVGQVLRAIESDLDDEGWARAALVPSVVSPSGAELVWEHDHQREAKGVDKRGKMTYRTTANNLTVFNSGSVAAENLTFELTSVAGTEFIFEGPEEPVTVHPNSRMAWLLIPTPSMGSTGKNVQITADWTEAGEPCQGTWTITLNG